MAGVTLRFACDLTADYADDADGLGVDRGVLARRWQADSGQRRPHKRGRLV